MKYLQLIAIALLASCKAQFQTVRWKEPDCMCQIHKATVAFLVKEMGTDSFKKVSNKIMIRYSVSKDDNRKIRIIKNAGMYITNERFTEFILRANYNCLFQLFPNDQAIIVPFSQEAIRDYNCSE